MKKTFNYSRNEEAYKVEIEEMLDELTPVVVDFLKQFNAEVIGFEYDGKTSMVTSDVTYHIKGKSHYPSVMISFSRIGKSFTTAEGKKGMTVPKPRERKLSASFFMNGFDDGLHYVGNGITISKTLCVQEENDEKLTPVEKLKSTFAKADEWMQLWHNYGVVADVFLF